MSESSPKYQRRYQSGLGSAASMLGSGGLSNAGGPTKNAATAIAMINSVEIITSRQARSGQKRLTTLLEQLFVFGTVGRRIDWFACNRRLRDSVPKNQPDMQADKGKHDSRKDENMDGKEPTKCRAANGVATQDEARHPVADNRNAPGLLRRDHDRPCCG